MSMWASHDDTLEERVSKWQDAYNALYSLLTQCEHMKSKKLTESSSKFKPFYKELKDKTDTIKQSIDKCQEMISMTNEIFSKSMSSINRFELVLKIKRFKIKTGYDDMKCLFFIYNNCTKQFLSQQYCLKLSKDNFEENNVDQTHYHDINILFKNLTKEILIDDIYIIAHFYRIGPMQYEQFNMKYHEKVKNKTRKQQNIYFRPFAISIFKLKNYTKQLIQNIGKEIHIESDETPICETDENIFGNLPFIINKMKELTECDRYGKRARMRIVPESMGFSHSYILFHDDLDYNDFDQLQMMESLHHDSNALNIYVTIIEAHVNQRSKAAQCNVCTKMCIKHNITKEITKQCIKFGKSSSIEDEMEDGIETAVHYHNNDPIYNQMFTINLSNIFDGISNYHLFFNCSHCSASQYREADERGFGFIKLSELVNKSGYNEYEISLYRELTKNNESNIDYIASKSLLKPDGGWNWKRCIKIGVHTNNIKEYFEKIVLGYIQCIENQLFCVIPKDLKKLIFQYLNIY